MIRNWLRAFRPHHPETAADIHRRLDELRRARTEALTRRQALAYAALRDETAAANWTHEDEAARDLARQIELLETALPQASAQDAAAARAADAAALASQREEYERVCADASAWLAGILQQMPSGPVLTDARDRSRTVARLAGELHRRTGERHYHRPAVDPLGGIYDACVARIQRVERARWAKSAPITLLDDTRAAS